MPSWKKVIVSGSDAALNSLTTPVGTINNITASYAMTASYAPNLTISGSINNVGYIDFNTSYTATQPVAGRLSWNSADGTLDLGMKGGNVTQQIGEEIFYEVRNETGTPIDNGTLLYANGVTAGSGRITATPYTADGSVREVRLLGMATETISTGVNGFVTHFGYVRGLDTRGTTASSIAVGDETWAVGDILYAHPTVAGKLTNVRPKHEISVAIVIIRHQSTGVVFVRPTSYGHLDDIHDVSISTGSLASGDLLVYSSTLDYWQNSKQLTGSYGLTGSLSATSFTGSLFGTASYATQALSSSFSISSSRAISSSFATTSATASNVNTLNQNVLITGSLTVGATSVGASENTITLGARDTANEGGQIGFNAPGGTYTSASFIDNWQNKHRILKGNNTTSTGLIAQWDIHTTQMQLPSYTSTSAFPGTAAANLAVDSSGNVITVSTSGGTVFPYTGNAVITGSLTTTGIIYAQPNGGKYFQGGDDAGLYDINVVNTMGIYGEQTVTEGAVKLGSNGPVLYGSGSRLGIGTTTPTLGTLQVNGNVWATSLTGSLQGTASYATTSLSSSYALTAATASNGSNTFTIGSNKIFSQYNSGGTANDALKLSTTNLGAVFGVQNTNASGFSGIEYIDNANAVKVFTGYNNSGTGEFRFNNIASNGFITFKIGSADKLTIANSGNVGIDTANPNAKLDVNGNAIITGSLTVTGRITAEEFHTEFVSASIVYQSGSTKFGNSSDDVMSVTGSLRVNGSITGSLFGTASFATTASYVNPLNQNVIVTGNLNTLGTGVIGSATSLADYTINDGVSSMMDYDQIDLWSAYTVTGEILWNERIDEIVIKGQLVTQTPSGWVLADNRVGTGIFSYMLGIALKNAGPGDRAPILLKGIVTSEYNVDQTTANSGTPVYMDGSSDNGAGYMVSTAPSSNGRTVRIVGYTYINSSNQSASQYVLRFDPSSTWLEL
jgi:hypothetical protein